MGKFDGAGDKFGLSRAFSKGKKTNLSVEVVDSQAKEKAKRFKRLKEVAGTNQALHRARRKLERRSIATRLQHSADTPIHPLWSHLPSEKRSRRSLFRLRLRRLWAWLKESRQRICIVLILYVLIWLVPILLGQPLMTIFAFLPLVLVPPVGCLIYWLVWLEFHA